MTSDLINIFRPIPDNINNFIDCKNITDLGLIQNNLDDISNTNNMDLWIDSRLNIKDSKFIGSYIEVEKLFSSIRNILILITTKYITNEIPNYNILKFLEFCLLLLSIDKDILAISDTHLGNSYTTNEVALCLSNYPFILKHNVSLFIEENKNDTTSKIAKDVLNTAIYATNSTVPKGQGYRS
jgi:hypothetical protein